MVTRGGEGEKSLIPSQLLTSIGPHRLLLLLNIVVWRPTKEDFHFRSVTHKARTQLGQEIQSVWIMFGI